MRTSETLLLDFIRQSSQFRIPVNQRRFVWTQRECRQLWEDILDAGERGDVREHFLGPVMYLAAVDPLNAHWSPYLVYDGQQRLTTVSLILEALARHLRDDAAPDGFEPAQIRNDYLLNALRKADQHYRLLLKPGDSETLLALIHDRPRPASPSPRILEAARVLRETGQAAGAGRLGAVRGALQAPHRRLRPQGGRGQPTQKPRAGSSPLQSGASPPRSSGAAKQPALPATAPTSHLHPTSAIVSIMTLVDTSIVSNPDRTAWPDHTNRRRRPTAEAYNLSAKYWH